MIEIIHSETFMKWFDRLRDRHARARIQARIDRFAFGNPGDVKLLRDGISELRIDYGPGYRIYFMRRGSLMVVLLAGGDKQSQERDIERAITISRDWRD